MWPYIMIKLNKREEKTPPCIFNPQRNIFFNRKSNFEFEFREMGNKKRKPATSIPPDMILTYIRRVSRGKINERRIFSQKYTNLFSHWLPATRGAFCI